MYPVTVIDNFYEDPFKIRDFALAQKFYQQGSWPGLRTGQINELDPTLFGNFAKKVLSIFFNIHHEQVYWNFNSTFQLCGSSFEEGWVHADCDGINPNGPKFAGVVYLTPNAPLTGGTSVYKLKDNEYADYYSIDWTYRDEFYRGNLSCNLDQYRIYRNLHNEKFLKTIDISNVFNRLVIYNAADYHRENTLFGSIKEDSRLTQVFFAHIDSDNHPYTRMSTTSKI